MAAVSPLAGLRARWDQLSERERSLVATFGIVAVVVLVAMGAFVGRRNLSELSDENADIRRVLREIDENRDSYQRLKAKSGQVEARLGHGEVKLDGFVEAAAIASQVEVKETNERPPQDVGNKKFKERSVDVRIQKVTLEKLAHFLRRLETQAQFVVVTGLTARVRDDRHEDLEVELTLTTWDKADPVKKPAAAAKDEAREDVR